MSFDASKLVLDRTQADVDYVTQLTERIRAGTASAEDLAAWNSATLKGAYNYTDLNRVCEAVEALYSLLQRHGYKLIIRPQKSWTESEWPDEAAAQLYLDNIRELRMRLNLNTTPAAPLTLQGLTPAQANAVEQILLDAEKALQASLQVKLHSAQPLMFGGFAVYPKNN